MRVCPVSVDQHLFGRKTHSCRSETRPRSPRMSTRRMNSRSNLRCFVRQFRLKKGEPSGRRKQHFRIRGRQAKFADTWEGRKRRYVGSMYGLCRGNAIAAGERTGYCVAGHEKLHSTRRVNGPTERRRREGHR
eukprot:1042044-Pleurochrysis_carterae.AAC.2